MSIFNKKKQKEEPSKYYRHSWWLFANEEDFLYCRMLNRHPKAQPNVSFFSNITAHDPEIGKKEFDLNNLFRTRAIPLSGPKLSKKEVEFNDIQRYRDFTSLLDEINNGKILGLCVANAVEAGSKKNMLDMDPNELFWKWDFWSKQKIEKNYIIIEVQVINVADVSDTQCSEAIAKYGINGAKVRLYTAEKINNVEYNVKDTGIFEVTHETSKGKGYAIFILSKEQYANAKILFGGFKKDHKLAPDPVIIHDRTESEEGFNPDQHCGNPENVILLNQPKIEEIKIPLQKKGKFEGDNYPLLKYTVNKKKTQYVSSSNTSKPEDYVFTTEGTKKIKHVLEYKPEQVYVAMYVFNLDTESVENNVDLKWLLKFGNKKEERFKFNEIQESKYWELIKLKNNLSFHTNVEASNKKGQNLIRGYFEEMYKSKNKNNYLVTAMLIDKKRYNDKKNKNKLNDQLEKEFKLIMRSVKNENAFKEYAEKNPNDIIIYDFDFLKIDNENIDKSKEKTKNTKKKKLTKLEKRTNILIKSLNKEFKDLNSEEFQELTTNWMDMTKLDLFKRFKNIFKKKHTVEELLENFKKNEQYNSHKDLFNFLCSLTNNLKNHFNTVFNEKTLKKKDFPKGKFAKELLDCLEKSADFSEKTHKEFLVEFTNYLDSNSFLSLVDENEFKKQISLLKEVLNKGNFVSSSVLSSILFLQIVVHYLKEDLKNN